MVELEMTAQKSILITGCSSGIGYRSAHYMREQGWQVFASCRKMSDCQRLEAEGFISPLIDYVDDASIQNGLGQVLDITAGRLDALFNNGAFASPGMGEDISRGALEEIFQTNVFGVHELTRHTLPIMRAQGHGRIVQCSSVLGFIGAKGRSAYVASKHALEGLADVMRLELAAEPIDLILIEPGPIGTKIRENAQAHFEKWIDWKNSTHRDLYERTFIPRLYSLSEQKDKYELPPLAVAKKLHRALTARKPKQRYYVTTPTYMAALAKRFLPIGLQDRFLQNF